MRAIVLVSLLLVGAAGCASTHEPTPTSLVITYGLGEPANRPWLVQTTCPFGAHCEVTRVRGEVPHQWALVARYTLTCDPAGGTHPTPQLACDALRMYERGLRQGTGCLCQRSRVAPGNARGEIDGRPTSLGLDLCTACGHPNALRVLSVILPGFP